MKNADNVTVLKKEYEWFSKVLDIRFKLYFNQDCIYRSIWEIPIPDLHNDASMYAQIIRKYDLTPKQRLTLLLAIAPHVYPQILDMFFTQNADYQRGFTEFGGIKGVNHGGFLPTGETVAFLLGGNDILERFQVMNLFHNDSVFMENQILELQHPNSAEPFLSGVLVINKEFLYLFTVGQSYSPPFSTEFPAQKITTKLEWEDWVADEHIHEEIQQIIIWTKNINLFKDDILLSKMIKPGFRTLFYGPSGTGKTLTATLLGKSLGREVFRVDLSKIVSKYIGETEKNLARVFDYAEHKDWILFFDEADALFGKRSNTSDAKDRYANQEVAFLLQRIEDFDGLIILATNLKGNIDDAFARRFQSMIYFPIPNVIQRLELWKKIFSHTSIELDKKISFSEIAKSYEVTGGTIINVFRRCVLLALGREKSFIFAKDIHFSVKLELRKEGKSV